MIFCLFVCVFVLIWIDFIFVTIKTRELFGRKLVNAGKCHVTDASNSTAKEMIVLQCLGLFPDTLKFTCMEIVLMFPSVRWALTSTMEQKIIQYMSWICQGRMAWEY